jgi:hypothetical protein
MNLHAHQTLKECFADFIKKGHNPPVTEPVLIDYMEAAFFAGALETIRLTNEFELKIQQEVDEWVDKHLPEDEK